MDPRSVIDQFKKAGLDIQVMSSPIRTGRGMDEIVQLDIERKTQGTRRYEKFRIFLGHKDNLIQVRDVDKSTNQLVLMVREPAREFEEEIRLNKFTTEERVIKELTSRGAGNRPRAVKWRKSGNSIFVTQKTTEAIRYFLAGVDERQLFIAQLTGPATTCEEARKSLGKSVEFANGDRRKGSALDRQGEWFFLEVSKEDRDEIDLAIRKLRTSIKKKVSIGAELGRRGGNAHTADELVRMPAGPILNHRFAARSRDRVFVRGCVRHVDHKTVRFDNWREVIANTEGATASASASGVFWVD